MTDAGVYDYRPLERARCGELLEIYRRLYPTLGWSQEYMRWQYFDNPAGPARIWTAQQDGQIAASYAAMPHWLYQNGEVAAAWRVQDVLTLEEHRGQGIYHQLAARAAKELFIEEHPLNFTFPNEHSRSGFLRNGWTAPFQLPLKVKSPLDFPRRVAPRARPLAAFGGEAEDVWRSYRGRIGFGVDRSCAYLNWRYFANPKSQYLPFQLDAAILVLKLFAREDKTRCCHLMDFFQAERDAKLAAEAFAFWADFSLANDCSFMSCWSTASGELELPLKAAGFAPQPGFDRWLVINPNPAERFAKAGKRPEQEQSWHLVMGDSDVF